MLLAIERDIEVTDHYIEERLGQEVVQAPVMIL